MNVNNTNQDTVKNSTPALLTVVALILIAAITRLVPHAANFTAIGAMAVFAGALLPSRTLAVMVPVIALLIGDLVMGFHNTMVYVYGSIAISALLSFQFLKNDSVPKKVGMTLFSSVLFFAITNLGVWAQGGMYTMDLDGLMSCYLMAIPFFRTQVVADLFFAGILFGTWEILRRQVFLAKEA